MPAKTTAKPTGNVPGVSCRSIRSSQVTQFGLDATCVASSPSLRPIRVVIVRVSSFSFRKYTAQSALTIRSMSAATAARCASTSAMPSDDDDVCSAVWTNSRSDSRSWTIRCAIAASIPFENENDPTGSTESPNCSRRKTSVIDPIATIIPPARACRAPEPAARPPCSDHAQSPRGATRETARASANRRDAADRRGNSARPTEPSRRIGEPARR